MPANLAVDKSPGDDKHRKSEYNDDESTRSTLRQSSTSYQNRRPSVTFDLPPLSYHPGDEQPHQHQSQPQHRKRVSTHSKTSSIGSIGGQSITSSVSSSISASSASATPTSGASPARRQLRKGKRASTISSFTTVEERNTSSSVMRFGVKLDFNKRSSKRISQDSFSKELPPLPHEVLEKRVSGRLPLPPFTASDYAEAPFSGLSLHTHDADVLHIKNHDRRRSSFKSRTDLPPLPSEAAHTQHHHYIRQKQTALSSAQHLAEVNRQTELWLSMLCSSNDDGDNLFTPSLSSSSSNSSLSGKSPTPSSDCCDPDFLASSNKAYAVALPELPLPYTSPILLPPFSDVEAQQPLNPFEASFAANRNRQTSSSEVVLPNRRRSSLPTQSLITASSTDQRRLDKHRPPPLSLTPIQDSPAEENAPVQTALPPPPQYRSRSLSHDLRPLDPLSLYHRRFHRSSQDTTDLSTSTSRSRENSVSSSSAASMIFTSSNDSSIDNGSNGRRFSSATTVSSNMPSPKSPNHPRTPTLQDLLEEGAERELMDGKAVKHGSRQDLALSGRHSKQGSTGSVEVVMYGVAR